MPCEERLMATLEAFRTAGATIEITRDDMPCTVDGARIEPGTPGSISVSVTTASGRRLINDQYDLRDTETWEIVTAP